MRYLRLVTAMAWLAAGCAGVPREHLEAQALETERWRREYEAAAERTEALAARLAALESAMERLALERAEAEQARAVALEELVRTEADRHALEEQNAQLLALERELNELKQLKVAHEELSDVWYESALERARRRVSPPPPQQPAPSGGGNRTGSP